MYAKIVRNFLFDDEILKLNQWTLSNWKNPYFQDAHMDSLHPGTRFTTRMNNDLVARDTDVVIKYPKECYNVRNRIKNFFNLHNFNHPPSFYDGIVNGIGFSPGLIEDHIDPIYIQGTNTLHCNVITQNSKSGGITIIEGVEYPVSEGDLLMYVVSKHNHRVTEIEGDRERILWVFGFCVDDSKLEEIF